MSDNPDETEYYLRLVSMYINLGTETVHDVFVYHSPGKDPYAFLKSKEETLIELKGKKILNKQQCELLLEEDTWTEQLPPPRKGWDNPPRNSDKSIAADLLRLRTIRNVLVGNLSRARLSQDRFEEEWKNVSEILLRIQKQITQGNGASVQVKIDAYRSQRLDPLLKSKYDEKIKGWYEDVSKMQDKVEDLVSKLEGFDAYFKSKSDRYERYIKLLVQGGTFVLSSFLDEQIKRRGRDLRSVLDENKGTLMQSITDPKHLDVLYPSQTNGQSGPLDISTWSVSILAAIILQLFDNDIGTPTKRAITQIGNAYSNYADNAFIALDSNTFEDYILDLRASLEIVSDNLSEDQAKQFDQILADSKKQLGEHDFQTYMDELKSQGIQMKSFTDIFKETLQQTQDCLKGMITQGISFKNSHDLELRMISLGSGEDLMMILEESKLAEIWHEALDRSIQNPEFADVKKVVDKIQDQIRKSKNLANIAVLDKGCIILQERIYCISPRNLLEMIKYFESIEFHDSLDILSKEL